MEMPCHFKFKSDIICSEELIDLNYREKEVASCIITECGFLPSLLCSLYLICKNHFTKYLDDNTNRQRRKWCEVPSILNSHTKENEHFKCDRRLNLDNIKHINNKFGVILPIGTGKAVNIFTFSKHLT